LFPTPPSLCVFVKNQQLLLLFHPLTYYSVELPAHFFVWLASPEAEFLKGKLVWVNWAVDELKTRAGEIKASLLLKVVLNGVPM
jgi:hypothetical protein